MTNEASTGALGSVSDDGSVDRPIGRSRLATLLVLAGLIMLVDGADMAAMPLLVPYVAKAWSASPAEFGLALSAMPLGFGVGALLIGPFGDRHGRRPVIVGAMLLVALGTIAAAFSANSWHFALLRLVAGAGLGAALVNLNALMAEMVPRAVRARLLTIISCGIPVGAASAGFLVPLTVAASGWSGTMAILGGMIGLITLALFIWLPRGPAAPEFGGKRQSGHGIATLLRPLAPGHRPTTLVFVGLYTTNMLSLFMLSTWLPTVLVQAGFAMDDASRMAGVIQIGGLCGGLLLSTFVDLGKTVPALLASYALVIVLLLAFGAVPRTTLGWGLLLFLIGGGISGAHLSIMAMGTFFYPASMLASALGLATAVARIGAVLGPLLGQQLIQREVGAHGFMLSLIAPVAFCALCVSLIPKVRTS